MEEVKVKYSEFNDLCLHENLAPRRFLNSVTDMEVLYKAINPNSIEESLSPIIGKPRTSYNFNGLPQH